MATVVVIVVAAVAALSYSKKGLFAAAVTLVAVFLAVATALGFGAALARSLGIESPYAYGLSMIGIALFALAVIRGGLVFLDDDVDFHPAVDRIGGALAGAASGSVAVGFLCACLLCMPFPGALQKAERNTEHVAAAVLVPFDAVARLTRLNRPAHDDRALDLSTLRVAAGARFSPFEMPAPVPADSPGDRDAPLGSSPDVGEH